MLEVSFNSPQCGWMSIGFDDGVNEFHTTTAYTPYPEALQDLLRGLTSLKNGESKRDEFTILWSRNPEAYDFWISRDGQTVQFKIVEYPTTGREISEGNVVFDHQGDVSDFCRAFGETFARLYEDRETDEFEFNWRQPFPYREYEEFRKAATTN